MRSRNLLFFSIQSSKLTHTHSHTHAHTVYPCPISPLLISIYLFIYFVFFFFTFFYVFAWFAWALTRLLRLYFMLRRKVSTSKDTRWWRLSSRGYTGAAAPREGGTRLRRRRHTSSKYARTTRWRYDVFYHSAFYIQQERNPPRTDDDDDDDDDTHTAVHGTHGRPRR